MCKIFSWLNAHVIVHILCWPETLSTFVATIYLYKGSSPQEVSRFKWALPEWGGVSTLARMVCGLGHLFREELPMFKWAFAWLWGGQNACQDGVGHLCSEN